MDYRTLGRSGVKVSPLCLGGMNFGQETDAAETAAIIDTALDAGINFIDTANVYHAGRSEELIGAALQRNGKRGRVILATKVNGRMREDDPNGQGISRRHVIEQCEASLRRLQTDYIDLYQLHRPSAEVPIDETLRALDDLIRAGKVRYIGTSSFAAWQLMEALWAAKELGLNRVVSEQPPYSLLDRSIERELIPMARTYGLAIIPWSPLAGGFLSGKYTRGQPYAAGTRFADSHLRDWWQRQAESEQAWRVLDLVKELAWEKGCTPSQLALAWVTHQPGVTSPIIGPRTVAQLHDNLGALAMQFSNEERQRLDEVSPPMRDIVPLYGPWCGANFGPHQHRW